MLTEKQRAKRMTYLGGTDIPAILGVDGEGVRIDPYRTALEVYLEKKGEREPFQGNIHTQAGLVFEKSILAFYELQEDSVPLLNLPDEDLELHHPTYPFLIGHPDGIDENGGIIDAKNVGYQARFKWGDPEHLELPRQYIIQAFYYMALANSHGEIEAPYAKIIAYFGGSDLRVYTIPYNAVQGQGILEKAVKFWETHINGNIPPEPITYTEVADYFKAVDGETKYVDLLTLERLELYKANKELIDSLEKSQDQIKLQIGTYMGEAETLVDNHGKPLVSFKNQTSSRIDTKKIREDGLFEKYAKETTTRIMRFIGK